jgi:hypothetical protein
MIMKWSKKYIGKMQINTLFFNSFTSNELSACRKQEEYVLNVIGFNFRAMREKQFLVL